MAEISFHMQDVDIPGHDSEFLRLWINHIVKECGKHVNELSYIFCSDGYILDINKQYLSHDYYTDIITFDYCDGDSIAGDIFISVDTVTSNAEQFSSGDFEMELNRVIIHGVLHLCGFNDKTEEEQRVMTEREDWALNEMSRFT